MNGALLEASKSIEMFLAAAGILLNVALTLFVSFFVKPENEPALQLANCTPFGSGAAVGVADGAVVADGATVAEFVSTTKPLAFNLALTSRSFTYELSLNPLIASLTDTDSL